MRVTWRRSPTRALTSSGLVLSIQRKAYALTSGLPPEGPESSCRPSTGPAGAHVTSADKQEADTPFDGGAEGAEWMGRGRRPTSSSGNNTGP